MLFRAQHLGPLHDVEIDLSKNLIVLAGPNNSGKTYLAWSVYGLHRFRPVHIEALVQCAKTLLESQEHTINLTDVFQNAGQEILASIATQYKSNLHLCFSSEKSQFATANIELAGIPLLTGPKQQLHIRGFNNLSVDKSFSALLSVGDDTSARIDWTLLEGEGFSQFLTRTNEEGDFSSSLREFRDSTSERVSKLNSENKDEICRELNESLSKVVHSHLFPKCILFPAERIAVNIFAKELALKRTKLVDEMVDADLDNHGESTIELVRRKAGRYPWPIRDSLRIANDLANLSRENGPFAELADELEKTILGGEVVVSKSGEVTFSPVGRKEKPLELHLSASIVKSLSSLVFYFRFLARPNDFIVIDEPELNLHPDNQRKVARLLAKAVRLGFKVMISTHSDYILRELNHLLMLSRLPAEEAPGLGYDPNCSIAPVQLGVYLFIGGQVESIPVTDTGFSVKTIDDVVNQLNADEQRLYARLEQQE